MAAALIKADKTKEPLQAAIQAAKSIRDGMLRLEQARAAYIQGVDGSTAVASNFDLLALECGYAAGDYADANAATKASFDELDSLYSKICTDNNVSGVRSAILQYCAKHNV